MQRSPKRNEKLTAYAKCIKQMFQTILSLLGVGVLWGVTNPFIRLGSQGIEAIDTGSKIRNVCMEVRMIATRLKYWIPFLLNQLGSVLYVYTLQSTSMTAAVPIANSLSFAFTAITGYILGEQMPGKKVIIGTLFVCLGSALMIYDKVQQEEKSMELKF